MNKSNKIYVAGHNGMVGSAIVRKLRKQGFTNIVIRSSSELDLTNQQDIREIGATQYATKIEIFRCVVLMKVWKFHGFH
jgi:GDP-L-fucose synthase